MNKGILNTAGAAIEDVASSIAKSDWYAAIKPKDMKSEIASYVASSPKYLDKIAQEELRATVDSRMTDDIEAAIRKVSAKNLEASIDEHLKGMDGIPDAVIDVMKQRTSTALNDINKDNLAKQMTATERLLATPKAYFHHPDKKIRNTRIQTAVAAYAGVAVGGRYLSGGTLTTDNYGRKDIAGVPFV